MAGARMDDFSLALETHGAAAVVAVSGEIDLSTAPELYDAIVSGAQDREAVVVDLCACTFIDSSGLAALIRGVQKTEPLGRRIALACERDGAVWKLLDLAVPGAFAVHDSRGGALAGVGSGG